MRIQPTLLRAAAIIALCGGVSFAGQPAGRPMMSGRSFLNLVRMVEKAKFPLVCINDVWPGPPTADKGGPSGIFVPSRGGRCDGSVRGPRKQMYWDQNEALFPLQVDGRWLDAKYIDRVLSMAGSAAKSLETGNSGPAARLMIALQHAPFARARFKQEYDGYDYGKVRSLAASALKRLQ